jgi:hypothetical protein
MKPFDGRKGKRLSYETVADMRFFGFYIGNDTLFVQELGLDIVYEKSEHLGMIYALQLFKGYGEDGTDNEKSRQKSISIKDYIKSVYQNVEILPDKLPFTKQQLQTDKNWRSVIARFFMDFGLRTLNTFPLQDFKEDYAEDIIDYGGHLERLTAIICNIIRFDENYNVINEEWTCYRTSQYIRAINDENYKVIPAFKIWETSLWC